MIISDQYTKRIHKDIPAKNILATHMGGGWSKVLIVLFLPAINNSEPYANGVQIILIWDRARGGLPDSVPDLLITASITDWSLATHFSMMRKAQPHDCIARNRGLSCSIYPNYCQNCSVWTSRTILSKPILVLIEEYEGSRKRALFRPLGKKQYDPFHQ